MTSKLPDLDLAGIAGAQATDGSAADFANPLSAPDLQVGMSAGADEFSAAQSADPQETELNRAIEELRGVLNEEKSGDAQNASASPAAQHAAANAGVILNIPVEVQIVLGSTTMSVSDLMALRQGSTVSLDRRIGEPVDIVVNGRKIASGEITVLDNDPSRFGVRLTRIVDAAKPA